MAKKVSGEWGGGLQSWLHAELCGLCPSVLTVFLSLSSGLGSF